MSYQSWSLLISYQILATMKLQCANLIVAVLLTVGTLRIECSEHHGPTQTKDMVRDHVINVLQLMCYLCHTCIYQNRHTRAVFASELWWILKVLHVNLGTVRRCLIQRLDGGISSVQTVFRIRLRVIGSSFLCLGPLGLRSTHSYRIPVEEAQRMILLSPPI